MDKIDEIIALLESTYAAEIEDGIITILSPSYNYDTDKYARVIVGVDIELEDKL